MITPCILADRTRRPSARVSLFALSLLLIAAGAFAAKEPPAEWDGLKRVASNQVDHL